MLIKVCMVNLCLTGVCTVDWIRRLRKHIFGCINQFKRKILLACVCKVGVQLTELKSDKNYVNKCVCEGVKNER